MNRAESLARESAQAPAQVPVLTRDDRPAEVAFGAVLGALPADVLSNVEDDGNRQHVVPPGDAYQRGPGERLHVRRVDHGEPSGSQPDACDVVQGLEGGRRSRLVILV